jgi:hypothetical protein
MQNIKTSTEPGRLTGNLDAFHLPVIAMVFLKSGI